MKQEIYFSKHLNQNVVITECEEQIVYDDLNNIIDRMPKSVSISFTKNGEKRCEWIDDVDFSDFNSLEDIEKKMIELNKI